MAITKHARDLLFFDMIVSRRTHHAPFPKLPDLAALWIETASDKSAPVKTFEKGMVTCIIKDSHLDDHDNVLTLLIEVSDKNTPDTTYLDHQNRTGRTFKKEEPEGTGFAAHVLISLDEQKENTYTAAIEVMPTVSAARVQSVLNWTIRRLCAIDSELFTFVRPGGSKKAVSYVPHILLAGHPSDAFIKDIENGRINGMRLIKTEEKKSLGQKGYLKIKKYIAEVSVSKDIPQGERWSLLKKGAKMEKDKFPMARILVQPESGGKSFHVDIDSDTGALIGQAYTKSKRLTGFESMLHSSSPDVVVQEFRIKATSALKKEVG